ncbi:hypothetical protein B0J15DRAFT_575655 [Fusarium solani]|uniref:Zn(2)-C6 fungal-type domain-containing protein n=1 Tax=Fusarium solani TaxID=169388 RepID=A0A9P9JVF8_FUSSL|nr:uncharacterized protein B0J15DRAFT_575655 [Fusarium solani]KAH7230339.1 hypothetical protein B0J15DRAFT_575655 [Fusarium solani]
MPSKKVKDANRRRCTRACNNCKRRKVRCTGNIPCHPCIQGGIHSACKFSMRKFVNRSLLSLEDNPGDSQSMETRPVILGANQPSETLRTHPTEPSSLDSPGSPGLIKQPPGKDIFPGDAVHAPLLRKICSLVCARLQCSDLEHDLMSDTNAGQCHDTGHSLMEAATNPPLKPTSREAKYLIELYRQATALVFDVIDLVELDEGLLEWLKRPPHETNIESAVYYLVLAIGAQSSPGDRDELAERFFSYGQYLTIISVMEGPSTSAIRSQVLLTIYLLAGLRFSSAFVHLAFAIRGARALGLGQGKASLPSLPSKHRPQERLWRTIQILDLFMSASRGSSPSTVETDNPTITGDGSILNQLLSIFKKVLSETCHEWGFSPETQMSMHGTRTGSTAQQVGFLKTEATQLDGPVGEGPGHLSNISIIHLTGAYYWTVMSLSQSYLLEMVSSIIAQSPNLDNSAGHHHVFPISTDIIGHACLSSAIRTIDLCQIFLSSEHTPKRLPFVGNSVFMSALIISLAFFGDLDHSFPLDKGLDTAHSILGHLSKHDAMARRNLSIVGRLREACNAHISHRVRRQMEHENQQTHAGTPTYNPPGSRGPVRVSPAASTPDAKPQPPASKTATATTTRTNPSDTRLVVSSGIDGIYSQIGNGSKNRVNCPANANPQTNCPGDLMTRAS